MSVRIAVPAKLNLCLHVTGKRADGFHLLQSLAVFASLGDVLDIETADTLSLTLAGPFAQALSEGGNLVLKAAQALQAGKGARMVLHKNIPVGAGLGGGSSDAAAALLGLAGLWQLSGKNLQQLAQSLGSDVPVCLRAPHPAWMEGVGERVTPVSLPSLHMVLVNPGRPLLTADVFRRFSGSFSAPVALPDIASLPALKTFLFSTRNDLEAPAIALQPEIDDVLAALRGTGCWLARMSGSGATCFGLYDAKEEARNAEQRLKTGHPSWWVAHG